MSHEPVFRCVFNFLVTAEVVQQEVTRCHEGKGAEILIVLCVVSDDNVAQGGKVRGYPQAA